MEIARTAAGRCGQIGQRRLLLAFLYQPTGAGGNGDVLRLNRESVRIATLARSKARRLGLLDGVMKQDVLGIGDPGRAGWPAVNASCQNRVPKMTISRSVAGDNTRPPRIIGHGGLVLPLALLVDHGHVRSHRLGEGDHHQAVGGLPTPGPVFTLPMARLSAHPISEDIVRTRFFRFEGKNRISAAPPTIMVAAKAHAIAENIMKLVRFDGGKTGLMVQLASGPHVIDVIGSLGALSPDDPISQGILNGILKDKGSWAPLIDHWEQARSGLRRLASLALATSGRLNLVISRAEEVSLAAPLGHPGRIATLDIGESSEVAQDPTGREAMERQFRSFADTQVTSVIPFPDKIRSVDISLPLQDS